jgi:hypothetical protein
VLGFARRPAMLALLLATVSPTSALGGDTRLDPTVPRVVVVGEPKGAASMPRIDGARSSRARTLLPRDPIVRARWRLLADVITTPAVDAGGNLVVASSDGVLSQLDARGHVEWTAALGGEARIGPVIASDGTRVVVTERGDVLGFTESGERAFHARVDDARGAVRAAPLGTRDGSVVIAVGSRAIRVGRDGAIVSTAVTEDPIVALVERGRTTFIVTDAGTVLAWQPPALPRELWTFGGRPTSDVVAGGGTTLLTVVRDSTLISLDLRDGRRETLATAVAPDALTSAPAVLRSGELRFLTRMGWLVGHDGDRETFRLSVFPTGAVPASPSTTPSLPALSDETGAVAFVGGAAMVGVASPSHDVRSVPVEGCGTPLALLPRAPRSMVLVCRSGLVAVLEER